MNKREQMFETELLALRGKGNIEAAKYLINQVLPPDFFVIQPSMTGKYHPECTHRKGGLVVHTKRLIYLALELAEANQLSPEEKDMLILAGITHDMAKKKDYVSRQFEQHPIDARDMIAKAEPELTKYATQDTLDTVKQLVQHHMGPWTPDQIKKPLRDYSHLELILYYADYLASRKFIGTPVDTVDIYDLD